MNRKLQLLVAFLVNGYFIMEVHSLVEFTNIKCQSVDKNFSKFETCRLKSINRTYKYFSVKVNLLKLPITNAQINAALYKRFNGYKPFLYNVTVDGCRFIANPNSNPVGKYLYYAFKNVSNVNHSCPYNHDLVIDKLSTKIINDRMTYLLPFPEGDYMIKMNWMAFNVSRAIFQLYFSLANRL
ncbi:uncharacterized protein LOC108112103 [Drosophila eugracilis]|uniref:uncharacterized protein LOC108112103 n=1 Tax=Drosophila eugracilis TaxID=29029 RepID=UPI0007E5C6DB|nr:uncharacterized protein LOC108112103 [Drosophila eugracilis]